MIITVDKPPPLAGRLSKVWLLRQSSITIVDEPPKFAVLSVVGYVKGKSAIHVARHFLGKARNYTGQALWARGFFVSTVGIDEETIRKYIQHQEEEDNRLDQLNLFRAKEADDEEKRKE